MQPYTYTCRNIINTIKTSGHSSLEKYTSHFIERVVCEKELETEQRLQHINPPPNSSGYHCLSFPFFWAAQPVALGPSVCWDIVLIPATFLQLIGASCRWCYIIIWRPRTSCERHNSHSIQTLRQSRLSPDIFDRMHLLFTQVHFFFWQLGRGQYVTRWQIWEIWSAGAPFIANNEDPIGIFGILTVLILGT